MPEGHRTDERSAAVDRFVEELEGYLAAQAQRLLAASGRKLGRATVKLSETAEGRSPGLAELALEGGRRVVAGKGPVRAALETGASRLKDTVAGALGSIGSRRGSGGSGQRPTVILEQVDVGVPVRQAYDQWTRLQDFSTFAEGVRSATATDATTSEWTAGICWSTRSWKAHITEQIPDRRIAWSSEGAKGTTRGTVTFHSLGEDLTRVLLVVEYYPKGLFEKTGNLWRAQGRRVRLDLKHFARHVSLRGEPPEGWRGEIRDGEVVDDTDTDATDTDATGEEPEDAYAEDGEYPDEPFRDDDADAEDEGYEYADDEEEYEYADASGEERR